MAKTIKNIGLKDGEKCLVSWRGVREGVFKNQRNGVCFVTFDNGDGTGTRLHRVLTSTVKPIPKATAPKKRNFEAKAPSAEPKARKSDAFKSEFIRKACKGAAHGYCNMTGHQWGLTSDEVVDVTSGKRWAIKNIVVNNDAGCIVEVVSATGKLSATLFADKTTGEKVMWRFMPVAKKATK